MQASRLQGGPRKITYITEVVGMEQDTVVMQDIYRYDKEGVDENGRAYGQFVATGVRPRSCRGWSRPACACRPAPSASGSCWRIKPLSPLLIGSPGVRGSRRPGGRRGHAAARQAAPARSKTASTC